MFIYNLKINGSKAFKYFFFGSILLLIIILCIVIFKLFNGASKISGNSPCMPQNNVSKISPQNYTNILKAVHENIDSYVGLKINFTGYVYRIFDLKENQFILSRNMVVSSDFKSVVVGFLTECDNAKDFEDNTWVEVTGEIYKGDYYGDMPILKVIEIKKVDKPNDEYVYPPDESYIPTSGLL